MDMSPDEYKEFKKEFWLWYDMLPKRKKATFWYYNYDMAETNFYFTTYMKRKVKNDRREDNS